MTRRATRQRTTQETDVAITIDLDGTGRAEIDTGLADSATADDGSDVPTTPAEDEAKPSKIKHVFVVALAGRGFDATFGPQSGACSGM